MAGTSASWEQLQELGLRIRRGQIPLWKIPAVFGIVEDDPLGQYLRLVEEARKGTISAEQVQALMEGKDEALGIFKVTVDYGQPLAERIILGHYDWVNIGITSRRFPIQGGDEVKREFVLVYLNPMASTEKVLAEMNRRVLHPAKIEDLLAFGMKFPREQREFQIVELGSSFVDNHGDRNFVCLIQDGTQRGLALREDAYVRGGCWFLTVRKDAA